MSRPEEPNAEAPTLRSRRPWVLLLLAGVAILLTILLGYSGSGPEPLEEERDFSLEEESDPSGEARQIPSPEASPDAAPAQRPGPAPVASGSVPAMGQAGPRGGPAPAVSAPGTYKWKSNTTYRFRQQRTVHVRREGTGPQPAGTQPDSSGAKTEWEGILVLHVRQVESDGSAKALLRYDSPQVRLPFNSDYDPETGELKLDREGSVRMAQALGNCLRQMEWEVELAASGVLRVLKRRPEDLLAWLEEAKLAGDWKRKLFSDLKRLVTTDLGLWGDAPDSDLLAVVSSGTAPAAQASKVADLLRPVRTQGAVRSEENGRLVWPLRRTARPEAKAGTVVELADFLSAGRPLAITTGAMSGTGRVVFDPLVGMLDRYEESYQVAMTCGKGSRAISQQVEVVGRLERLAPPLRGLGSEAE